MSLFDSGVRPAIDEYLRLKSLEVRSYGDYWSASSAGYCMRLNIMRRLGVPPIPEIADDKARTQRVFSSGHVFHEWIQGITKGAGISVAQELELQDEKLMVRGHVDDIILIKQDYVNYPSITTDKLILYDYKTAHSTSFSYAKDRPIGHYHKMQLATYMYMLRQTEAYKGIEESRRMSISKDDLRMSEVQLMWDDELEAEVLLYWGTLNSWWNDKKLPPCTCLEHDGGFMGRRSKKGKIYNDYFYEEVPCSTEWYKLNKKEVQSVRND